MAKFGSARSQRTKKLGLVAGILRFALSHLETSRASLGHMLSGMEGIDRRAGRLKIDRNVA